MIANCKNKKLLVISHSYSNFIKDQIESLSPSFEEIYVFVRLNPIAELSKFLPIELLKPFTQSARIDLFKKPSNIHVIPTPIFYFPFDFSYKNLGEQHYKAVDQIIKKEKITFDLIHAHFTWSAGYVGAKLKERYKVPFVVTAHGYDIYSLPFEDAIWKKNIEYILKTADAIITVSQNNRDCIRKLNTNTPVYVIPNGFRNDLFFPRDTFTCKQQLNLPTDKKILLTIGYLDFSDKGQNYLIDAIREIIQVRHDFLCVIIGLGKDKHSLEKQTMSLGLEDYVMLAGGKPHDEIPLWINACDVFVLPSLKEGNPTVMFECLGCGKPFVGTRVGGVPEVILSDDYGLLVEPADTGDLANKIMMALDSEWDQKKILAYAEQFAWENIAKEILKIYQGLGMQIEPDLERDNASQDVLKV